jgi:hypothetical protein
MVGSGMAVGSGAAVGSAAGVACPPQAVNTNAAIITNTSNLERMGSPPMDEKGFSNTSVTIPGPA